MVGGIRGGEFVSGVVGSSPNGLDSCEPIGEGVGGKNGNANYPSLCISGEPVVRKKGNLGRRSFSVISYPEKLGKGPPGRGGRK